MKAYVVAGALVAGLLAGCGGVEEDGLETEQPHLATREDRLICITQHIVVFYSDATYTTEVGVEHCYCGYRPTLEGQRTLYRQVYSEQSC
ncbi:hypothetical protein HPC49_04805 [Pyxidicoccus fallax]|uniref:Lipoprotein n=1 Tax=Pyxidicoccus fallax TaxID=394095 RepID=A0A848LCM8_9BACT|nr:hypothetical protein [Pyxidicoccus fallax]NMO16830.1 hypothetical protein [Pyxidicoccus fallax]NPC77571.1 hypothetical protein [Pyxidicoccus fallax]